MDSFNDYQNSSQPSVPQNEPKIENDYVNHPEIVQPDPATATPSIPPEMPQR